ncbi:EpsI family protein [Myxococcota bacterium]|nr:EpsI family protein [Myxococcota bacterium]
MSTSTDSQGHHSDSQEDSGSSDGSFAARKQVSFSLLVGFLLFACFAYRDLIRVRLHHGAAAELENWFFVSDETSPAVVVGMSAWLLYRRWGPLSQLTPAGSWVSVLAGGVLSALGVGVAGWAYYTLSPDFLAPSLSLVGLGVAALVWGAPGARLVTLPALFLLFAIELPGPFLNEMAFRLQTWTAHYTGFLLYLFDMPAVVSGDQIFRKSATFMVIENCSGLRSIETLSMLTLLMVDLFERRRLHAILLLLCAPPVAFVLNGFRVLLLIVNPHSDVASIHNLQGIAMLLGGLGLLYGVDLFLSRVLNAAPRGEVSPEPGVALRNSGPGEGWRYGVAAAVFLMVATISWGVPSYRQPIGPLISLSRQIPQVMGSWEAADLEVDEVFMGTLSFRERLFRRYREVDGMPVDLFAALGNHSAGMRGPLSPKTALPGSGWVVERSESVPIGDGGIRAEMRVTRSVAQRRLLYHWVSGYQGALREALSAGLRLERTPWARQRDSLTLRVGTLLETTGEASLAESRERLERFLAELLPHLQGLERRMERKKFSRFIQKRKTVSHQPPAS